MDCIVDLLMSDVLFSCGVLLFLGVAAVPLWALAAHLFDCSLGIGGSSL